MQLLLVVPESRLDASELSRACPLLVWCNAFTPFLCQAKDKEWWIKAFSQFCNKTANEEEEIVHKLLGDKFKVRAWQCSDVLNPQVCPLPASDCEPTGAEALLQLGWKSQARTGRTKPPIKGHLTHQRGRRLFKGFGLVV